MKALIGALAFALSLTACPATAQRGKITNTASLLAYWPMEDGSGTSVTDKWAGHTITLSNGPTWVFGIMGGATSYDGVDDSGTASLSAVGLTGATVSLWAKLGTASSANTVIQGWVASIAGSSQFLSIQEGSGNLSCRYSSGQRCTNFGVLTVGQWTHAAVTWDGTGIRTFRNGKNTDSYVGAATNQATATSFTFASGNSRFWQGSIDDVRVYSSVLGDTEIARIYAQRPLLIGR